MSKEEENRIFWEKFFIYKKDDIQKDVQLANNHRYPGQSGLYKKALFGLRRCNQERIAKEGKILSLEDITLNHIHFNFKYKTKPIKTEDEWGENYLIYINYKYNREVIKRLKVPPYFKEKLKTLDNCEGCTDHGYDNDLREDKTMYRLFFKIDTVCYNILERIKNNPKSLLKNVWLEMKEMGVVTRKNDYDILIKTFLCIIEKNQNIVRELKLEIPPYESILKEIISYEISSIPNEVIPIGASLPHQISYWYEYLCEGRISSIDC